MSGKQKFRYIKELAAILISTQTNSNNEFTKDIRSIFMKYMHIYIITMINY